MIYYEPYKKLINVEYIYKLCPLTIKVEDTTKGITLVFNAASYRPLSANTALGYTIFVGIYTTTSKNTIAMGISLGCGDMFATNRTITLDAGNTVGFKEYWDICQ